MVAEQRRAQRVRFRKMKTSLNRIDQMGHKGTTAEADRAPGVRQPQRGHAADAGRSEDRHRSAAKGAGLAGCIRRNMAFLQRSELACETPRTGSRGRGAGPGRGGRTRGAGENGDDVVADVGRLRAFRRPPEAISPGATALGFRSRLVAEGCGDERRGGH